MNAQTSSWHNIELQDIAAKGMQTGRGESVLRSTAWHVCLTAKTIRLALLGAIVLFSIGGQRLISATVNEPSRLADLPANSNQPTYDRTADTMRKALMSKEEAAWESVLEQNLGEYYLPRYKMEKLAGRETPWDFVADDPKLPRVLLIGDSISCGYTLTLRHALAGRVNVHRAPANCGSTTMGLKHLPAWLGGGKWDVIHFNFGIWDRNTDRAIYASNLEQIVTQLQRTGAKLIWARTTPPASSRNAEGYSLLQCEEVNVVADRIMRQNGIPMDDLCSLVQPRLAELQLTNNVHFNAAGYSALGRKVADTIQEAAGSSAVQKSVTKVTVQ